MKQSVDTASIDMDLANKIGIYCRTSFLNVGLVLLIAVYGIEIVKCRTNKQNIYAVSNDRIFPNTFEAVPAKSRVTCCGYCEQSHECRSVNFKEDSSECQLSKEPRVAVNVKGATQVGWQLYGKNGKE